MNYLEFTKSLFYIFININPSLELDLHRWGAIDEYVANFLWVYSLRSKLMACIEEDLKQQQCNQNIWVLYKIQNCSFPKKKNQSFNFRFCQGDYYHLPLPVFLAPYPMHFLVFSSLSLPQKWLEQTTVPSFPCSPVHWILRISHSWERHGAASIIGSQLKVGVSQESVWQRASGSGQQSLPRSMIL